MWFRTPLDIRTPGPARHGARRRQPPPAPRLRLEALEDRSVPSFSGVTDYPAGLNPRAVATADFNGDGRLDLATAGNGDNTVSVLLGNGDGTFQAARTAATGTGPASVLAGDLNGDGKPDLVTVNIRDAYSSAGDLRVLLGNGDGTFGPAQPVALPAQFPTGYSGSEPLPQVPGATALGDLDGDGRLDLVVGGRTRFYTLAGYDENGFPFYDQHDDAYVNGLLGNGNGTFGPGTVRHTGGGLLYGLVLADFTGDGRADVASSTGGGFLSVAPGNGDGTFRDAEQAYAGAWLMDIFNPAGDFDRDGKLDLLMRDGTGNAVVPMLGNGAGTFRRTADVPTGTSVHAAVVGDVNADGKLDVVVLNSAIEYGWCDYDGCYDPVTTRSARVLLGYGDGSFAVPGASDFGTFANASIFNSAALADFDGDGRPDLAAATSPTDTGSDYRGAVVVAHNDGTWTLPPPQPSIRVVGDVAITEGNTGTRAATFTVTLSLAYPGTVTVNYATYDAGASAGSDYQAVSGTLTFGPGQTTKTIAVPVNGDRFGEPDERFGILLSSPTNGTIASDRYYGFCTIRDDEPRISIGDVTRQEGKKGQSTLFTFTVTLSAAYDQAVTMSFRTADGTARSGDDYVARTGTLTFAPGETTKTITVEVKGDSKREGDETFYIDLFANSSNSLFTNTRGIGTILNDD